MRYNPEQKITTRVKSVGGGLIWQVLDNGKQIYPSLLVDGMLHMYMCVWKLERFGENLTLLVILVYVTGLVILNFLNTVLSLNVY